MAAFFAGSGLLGAQTRPPSVGAAFDRDSIMIGDQFNLEVRVEKDMMQVVDFPSLGGEVAPGVEILKEFPADTLSFDGRRQTIAKRYLLTIFDEGTYNLGLFPVLFADKNIVDTLYSRDSLRVSVATFAIDLEKDRPFDIKPPQRIPLRFGEIAGWFFLCVGIAALLTIGGWLLVRYRKQIPFLGGQKPSLPPHVEAIRRLEAIHHQKLWQNGRHKQYYTGITDILREYIDRRFGIPAMEMTTDEILAAVAAPGADEAVDKKRRSDLGSLLATADLVKFAKFIPGDDESETAYYSAYYFVEETKQVEIEGKAEESEDDI